jgi:hypothetical protein
LADAVRAGLRRERASVRTSFLVTGARLETGLDAGLADDFAADLPLATWPLRKLRAADGLASRNPLEPFAREPLCLLCPFPFPFFAVPCAQRT